MKTKEEIEQSMEDPIFRRYYGPDWERVKDATEFQNGKYGFEQPTEIRGWEWSYTFGRWGAFVTMADGWKGYTWPKRHNISLTERQR